MKNILFVLLVSVMVAGTLGCKKPPLPIEQEENNSSGNGSGGTGGEETKPSEYVGAWDYTKIVLTNGKLSTGGQGVGDFTGTGKDIDGEVIISENPNVYSTELTFTAAVDIMGTARDVPVEKQTSSGTWTEKNGEISLTDDSGKKIAVVSSNSSQIVFTGNFETEVALTQQFVLDATSDVEFTIEKK